MLQWPFLFNRPTTPHCVSVCRAPGGIFGYLSYLRDCKCSRYPNRRGRRSAWIDDPGKPSIDPDGFPSGGCSSRQSTPHRTPKERLILSLPFSIHCWLRYLKYSHTPSPPFSHRPKERRRGLPSYFSYPCFFWTRGPSLLLCPLDGVLHRWDYLITHPAPSSVPTGDPSALYVRTGLDFELFSPH